MLYTGASPYIDLLPCIGKHMEEDMNCLCTENRVLYNYCEFTKVRLLWQPAVRG